MNMIVNTSDLVVYEADINKNKASRKTALSKDSRKMGVSTEQ